MRRLAIASSIALTCTLLAPACSSEVCGCSFPDDTEAYFEGFVYSPDSVGIGGALVVPEVGGDCEHVDDEVDVVTAVSGHGGHFSNAGFAVPYDYGDLCVRVRALAPDSTSYLPSDYVIVDAEDFGDPTYELDLYLNR